MIANVGVFVTLIDVIIERLSAVSIPSTVKFPVESGARYIPLVEIVP